MASIFQHTQVSLPENALFKISPSRIAEFFECPINWYKSEVLGESTFSGNTATHIGTAVHYVAEQYAKSKLNNTLFENELVKSTIQTDLRAVSNTDVNKSEVLSLYPDMANALVNNYLAANLPTQVEYQTIAEVRDGIYVGGSVDNRTGGNPKYYCDDEGLELLSRL